MKVCPICGSKFGGEEVFCPHDGTRLDDMAPASDLVGGTLSGASFTLEQLMSVDDLAARYTSRLHQTPLRVLVLSQRLRPPHDRFHSLSATAALLGSPLPEALTTLYHWDATATPAYLVESGVKGPTLRQHLQEHGPLDVATAIKVTCSLARALGWLFEHGVIHRALSSNAIHLVDLERGTIQLAEWSLGLLGYHAHPRAALEEGKFLVTPEYSAPELIENAEKAGEKSSIYTLGLLLYEMLTAQVYFSAPTAEEVIALQLGADRPSISSAYTGDDLPEDLDDLFALLVNKSTQARFQSLHAVVNALCAQLPELDPSQFPKIERAAGHANPFDSLSAADPHPVQDPHMPGSPTPVEDEEDDEDERISGNTELFVKASVQVDDEGDEDEDEEDEDIYTSSKTLRMNAVSVASAQKSGARKKKKKKKKKRTSGSSASLDANTLSTTASGPKDAARDHDASSILIDSSLLAPSRSISGNSATLDGLAENAQAAPPETEPAAAIKVSNPAVDRTEKLPEIEKQLRELEQKKERADAKAFQAKKHKKAERIAPEPAPPAATNANDGADLWFASSSENTWDQEVLREHTARTDKKVRSTTIALLIAFGLAVLLFLLYILFLRPPEVEENVSLDPDYASQIESTLA